MSTNLKDALAIIMQKCRENGAGGTPESQVLCIAEEAGELVGAYRRWTGLARRRGTEEEVQAELADVVLSAYGMAEVFGWDLDEIIEKKLSVIFSRGWKEPQA